MAGTTATQHDEGSHAGGQLKHTGPAIVEEYYPHYATVENRITPLYSSPLIMGSAVILVSMCMLGLAVTAVAYHADGLGVSLTMGIVAVAIDVVVFLVGLGMCMWGFRKYARDEDEH